MPHLTLLPPCLGLPSAELWVLPAASPPEVPLMPPVGALLLLLLLLLLWPLLLPGNLAACLNPAALMPSLPSAATRVDASLSTSLSAASASQPESASPLVQPPATCAPLLLPYKPLMLVSSWVLCCFCCTSMAFLITSSMVIGPEKASSAADTRRRTSASFKPSCSSALPCRGLPTSCAASM